VFDLSQTAGVILFFVLAVAGLLAYESWRRRLERDNEAGGTIQVPRAGQEVAGRFTVEGELSTIPRAHHVWLALGSGGLLFPCEPEVQPRAGSFTLELEPEALAGELFSLSLILVGPKGQRAIEYWFLQGGLGEGYPGFERLPGAVELALVQGLSPASRSRSSPGSNPAIRQ
jgi:hypothetical protein